MKWDYEVNLILKRSSKWDQKDPSLFTKTFIRVNYPYYLYV